MSKPNDSGSLATYDVRLFETGNFADATIVCGDRTWKVHKALLSSRCKWFERAFFGNMVEAASGEIVFEEQEPELMDMMLRFLYAKGTSQDDEAFQARATEIPLTVRTDIDIAKLADGKGLPALSVKLFRLADFLMIADLAANAKAELRNHLDKLLAIPDGNDSDIRSTPERMQEMKEVFEAIREAYKGASTDHIQEMLLNFLWMRNGKVFQLPEVTVLLEEIPDMAKDLMRIYISGDATTQIHDTSNVAKGLLVLKAIRAPEFIYRKPNTKRAIKPLCVLRYTPGRLSPFEAVDADTGALIKELAWMTPATCQIFMIRSHDTSGIVCVILHGTENETQKLHFRFESPGDAKYYIGCHSGVVDRDVRQEKTTKSVLQGGMDAACCQIFQVAQPSFN